MAFLHCINEHFIKNRNRNTVAGLIVLSPSRTSNQITKAVDLLAGIIYQWEEECRFGSGTPFTIIEEDVAKVPHQVQFDDVSTNRNQQVNFQPQAVIAQQYTQQNTWWNQLSRAKQAGVFSIAGVLLTLTILIIVFYFGNTKQNPAASSNKWCDNFDATLLNLEKWGLMEDKEGLVSVENGALNFQANQALDGSIVGAEIILLPVGQPIKEISFTTTLASAEGSVPAAAGIGMFLQDGRDFALMFGTGEQGPEVEIYKCPDTLCNDEYAKYHTNRLPIPLREPMSVRVSNQENMLNFYVGDLLHDQEPINNRLNRLQFSMFAEQGSKFHVVIDDVCVVYEN